MSRCELIKLLEAHIVQKYRDIKNNSSYFRYLVSERIRESRIISSLSINNQSTIDQIKKLLLVILPQIDELHIYLNNDIDQSLLEYLKDYKKIRIWNEDDIHNRMGKFNLIFRKHYDEPFYFFPIDYNYIYPLDYVETMIHKIEKYNRQSIISASGKIFNHLPIHKYYLDQKNITYFNGTSLIQSDHQVHLVNTSIMAFHSDLLHQIKLELKDFKDHSMMDLYFSQKCERMKIPMIVIEHRSFWIQCTWRNEEQDCREKQAKMVNLINEHQWNQVLPIKIRVQQ